MCEEVSQPRRRLIKTKTPGVYKRGGRYVVVYRGPDGRQHKQAARTVAQARALKSSLSTDIRRGEWREQSKLTFLEYAREWIASYSGRTTRGFRMNTRDEYQRDLGFDADKKPIDRAATFFGRMRLAEIQPMHVRAYLQQLADAGLAVATIRKLRAPLRALLATAAEDGVIRSNPAAGVRIPANARVPEPRPKNVEPDIVAAFRERLDEADLLILDTFVALGPRYSELAALAINSLVIEGDETWIAVTERFYKGIDKPKSRYGIRRVQLSRALATRLRAQRARRLLSGASPSDPLFTSPLGARLNYSNLRRRWVPFMREAGIKWGAFHRFRHTTGTELHRRGASPGQIQLVLGHHDAAFTTRTYVFMDERDHPDPSILDDLASGSESGA